MSRKQEIIDSMKNGLIVSCQVEKHAPGYTETSVASLIEASIWAGACAIRVNGVENIVTARKLTELPIIGLIKVYRDDSDVFMTPTLNEAREVVNAGADIVAIDGTNRLLDGEPAYLIIRKIKETFPDLLILADVRDEVDADISLTEGADFVAPTFYRFKEDAVSTDLPDWKMFAAMCRISKDRGYVLMEGKVWTPDDAIKALYYGAHAVVVGTAITRPHIVARRFLDHMNGLKEERDLLY